MDAPSCPDPRVRPAVLLTCEHASHRVPAAFAGLFRGRDRLLLSHRGWDRDALPLARRLARRLDAPLIEGAVSRLLVDLNRPADDPDVFSRITGALPAETRRRLLDEHHTPHWRRVREALERLGRGRAVAHVAVHSFTPVRDGRRRDFDVGLLFDPERPGELSLARALRSALACRDARLRVRFNRPYLGSDPGLTTATRRRLPDGRYAGLELELNQRFARGHPGRHEAVHAAIGDALLDVLGPARATRSG